MEYVAMNGVEVLIPGGYEQDGAWRRNLCLRPCCGADEMFLCEQAEAVAPASWTTALLARCLSFDGGSRPVTPEFARSLTVGDREALLLHLRRITLGDRLSCVFSCAACGEKMDLDLKASQLLLPPYSYQGWNHHATCADAGGSCEVQFRLPNGADQECAAALVQHDEEQAVFLVLRRCIKNLADVGGRSIEGVPAAVARELPQLMADLDPQAELALNAACPACGATVQLFFDTAQYLLREIAQSSELLFREVHLLASHYHWSEAEILAMTGSRRRRYLAVIAGLAERRTQ
jgi:hypothetical protein